MDTCKSDALCSKCHDFKIIFSEILNVIQYLKANDMQVDKFNILVKLMDLNYSYTSELLNKAIHYEKDLSYNYSYKNEYNTNGFSKWMIRKPGKKSSCSQCSECGNSLKKRSKKRSISKSVVDLSSFKALADEFKDFRSYVNDFIVNKKDKTHRSSISIRNEKINSLPKIDEKVKLIDYYLQKGTSNPKLNEVTSEESITSKYDVWQTVNSELAHKFNKSTIVDKHDTFSRHIRMLKEYESSSSSATEDTSGYRDMFEKKAYESSDTVIFNPLVKDDDSTSDWKESKNEVHIDTYSTIDSTKNSSKKTSVALNDVPVIFAREEGSESNSEDSDDGSEQSVDVDIMTDAEIDRMLETKEEELEKVDESVEHVLLVDEVEKKDSIKVSAKVQKTAGIVRYLPPWRWTKKSRPSVCILADNIVQKLRMVEFNKYLKNSLAYLKCFPEATIDLFQHYVVTSFEEERPDILLICVGTNSLKSFDNRRDLTESEVVKGILKIVKMNRDAGVRRVLISSITYRQNLNKKIEAINGMLKMYAQSWFFTLIDNSNILPDKHLLEDGINLNYEGLSILGNNYIKAINNITNPNLDAA